MSCDIRESAEGFEVHFESLFQAGRGFCFPCDAQGRVALEALSARGRANYFYARAVVGRELAAPAVIRVKLRERTPVPGTGQATHRRLS